MMRVESQEVEILGHLLHRMVMHPSPTVEVRAVAVFYHGQGDYAARYPDVLEVFTQYGIRCIVTDLLGHGMSPGIRGHCGDEEFLNEVIYASLEAVGSFPYGVMGHSMGGLLALRHLVLAGKGLLPEPVFSWVSSPLVNPGRGHSPWLRKLSGYLAPVFPWITVSTGVTSAMCQVVEGDEKLPVVHEGPRLWHRRVSLAWGVFLIQTSEWLEVCARYAPKNVSLLLTQGGADPVCPPMNSKAVFDKLGCKNKSYVEIEGMLQEPFAGEGKDQLFTRLVEWIQCLDI